GLQDKKSAHERETLAQNQNPTPPGSHRARPVRTEAVLLQQNQTQLRPVGAPAPGANTCPPHSHRGRCSYNKNQSQLRPVGAPAPGANACPPLSHRGGAPTGSYNHTASQCG